MGDVDLLFDVRTALYLGNFQACINEAQKAKAPSDELKLEKDFLMYRAMVARGQHSVVRGEIGPQAAPELLAVRLLSAYLQTPRERASAAAALKQLQEDKAALTNPAVALVAGTVFALEGAHDDALRSLKHAESLETLALAIQIYLQINRVDMAKKDLKKMQDINDDATITQLACAWVNLGVGGEKLQDAYFGFQELADKYGASPLLLNGQAAALLAQGKYPEAEVLLLQAQEKNSSDAETLINLLAVSQFLNKPAEVVQRVLNQLKDGFPSHPFLVTLANKETEFDAAAAKYHHSA